VARWLRNRRAAHRAEGRWIDTLAVQNRLERLLPESASERRERANMFSELECPRAAVADLGAFLALESAGDDRATIRAHPARLQREASTLN